MTYWTMLMIKSDDGDGKTAANAHINRRCTEEAAESIPGFLHGEIMLSADDPGLFCAMCAWENEDAYKQWLASPLRAKQAQDLAGVIAGDVNTMAFQTEHVVEKPR